MRNEAILSKLPAIYPQQDKEGETKNEWCQNMGVMPGIWTISFSTGGFAWGDDLYIHGLLAQDKPMENRTTAHVVIAYPGQSS